MLTARRTHAERHRSGRANWLRAAVLGANDGLVVARSLLIGVAASGASRDTIPGRRLRGPGGRRPLDGGR